MGEAGRGFWVTCYTDASFTPAGAGWGVWMRSERGRIIRKGACPAYVTDSVGAELAAIFAGVFLARKAWGDAVRGIFVRTDCQTAIDLLRAEELRARLVRKQPGLVRLREKIRGLAEEHGIALDLRWVKGHQPGSATQAFLNRQCDRLARRSREAVVEAKKAEAKPSKSKGTRRGWSRKKKKRKGRGRAANQPRKDDRVGR